MVAPEIEGGGAPRRRAIVVKVNTDQVPELGERFGIRSIPTLAVFAGGREVTRFVGTRPAEDIEQLLEQAAVPNH
jgi:thioredoxin 2